MYFKSFGFFVAATAMSSASARYDVACLYPEKANEDLFIARTDIVWTLLEIEAFTELETPYVAHSSQEMAMCNAMCVAYHTPGMKDPLRHYDALFTVPSYGQNGYSMVSG